MARTRRSIPAEVPTQEGTALSSGGSQTAWAEAQRYADSLKASMEECARLWRAQLEKRGELALLEWSKNELSSPILEHHYFKECLMPQEAEQQFLQLVTYLDKTNADLKRTNEELHHKIEGALRQRSSGTPESKQETFDPRDEPLLRVLLVRLRYLKTPNDHLAPPLSVFTGKAGESRVYKFSLMSADKPLLLVAKFDTARRSAKEWEQIATLRHKIADNPQKCVILPHDGCNEGDGLILFRFARKYKGDVAVHLEEFLRNNLQRADNSAPFKGRQACVKLLTFALKKLHDILPPVSTEGVREQRPWSAVISGLPRITKLQEAACTGWDTPWGEQELVQVAAGSQVAALRNPVNSGEFSRQYYSDRVRKTRWSYVHGDLNLTNILLSCKSDGIPRGIFLIDLAHADPEGVTASDFARLEAEFWTEVYAEMAARVGKNPDAALEAFWNIRNLLDEKPSPRPKAGLERRDLKFMSHLRKAARQVLGATRKAKEDLFRCLYLSHLKTLGHIMLDEQKSPRPPEVRSLKIRVATLGAALALHFLPHPNDPPEVPPGHR